MGTTLKLCKINTDGSGYTVYEGEDFTCTPRVLPARASLFEPAGDVQLVRNEGSVPLVNRVIQLVPTGAPRLISEPKAGYCPDIN